MLSGKRLESIELGDVQALIADSHHEDREIDYKLGLPDLDGKRGADAKKELLKDVASFANGAGGDIVFGIEEGRDEQGRSNGIPVRAPGVALDNRDALERRWLEVLDAGLDPRIVPKVRLRVIDLIEGPNKVVILRIPRSTAAPHMVKETGWFYSRPGPLSLPMSTNEIRAAFELSEGWGRRVRSFRDERLGRLVGGDMPVAVPGDTHLVVHFVPFAVHAQLSRVDLHLLKRSLPTPIPPRFHGAMSAFNVDGVMVASDAHQGMAFSYTQFFRDGCAEFVASIDAQTKANTIVLQYAEELVLGAVRLIPVLVRAGAALPMAVLCSLTGTRGKRAYWNQYSDGPHPPMGRDVICLDDVLVENELDPAAAPAVLRPVFDGMWQCFGYDASPSYDPNGSRRPFKW